MDTSLPDFITFLDAHRQGRVLSMDEIKALRKTYRREYNKRYARKRLSHEKRLNIRLTHREYARIAEQAGRHSLSMNKYIKTTCLAYMDQHFVQPDEEPLNNIIRLLNKSSNSINQIVKRTHAACNKSLSQKHSELEPLTRAYDLLLKQVQDIKHTVQDQSKTLPPSIKVILMDYLKEQPHQAKDLRDFLEKEVAQHHDH